MENWLFRFVAAERMPSERGPVQALAALTLLFFVSGCSVALEPAYDKEILAEVEALTKETEVLFATINLGIPAAGLSERNKHYISLAARAGTIKLYAEARPAPSGKVVDFFSSRSSIPAAPTLLDSQSGERTTGSAEGERYANATAGYMEDYLRNLEKLAAKDRKNVAAAADRIATFEVEQLAYVEALTAHQKAYTAWLSGEGAKPIALLAAPDQPLGAVSKTYVGLRRIVLEDILRDALFYEREILNRNR